MPRQEARPRAWPEGAGALLGQQVLDQTRVPQESEGRRAVNGLGPPLRLLGQERMGLMDPGGFSPATRTNPLATTSLISSVLGWLLFVILLCLNWVILPLLAVATLGIGSVLYLCMVPAGCLSPIGWLVGVITGHMALGQLPRTGESGRGSAMTGVVSGWVGLALTLLTICAVAAMVALGVSIPFLQGFFDGIHRQGL